jgi:hypothetical protein
MMHSPTSARPSAWPNLHIFDAGAAAALAGLIAGAVYMPGRMLFAAAWTPHGSGAPLNRIAALLLGPDVLPPQPTSFVVIGIALLIHACLSLVCGQFIAHLVRRRPPVRAALFGLAIGLAIFVLNYVVIAPLMFPWFTDGAHLGTALSHMVFGAVAGGVFSLLRRPE